MRLTEELLGEANLRDDLARRLFGDLAYRSEALGHALAECGISLVTQRADQHGQQSSGLLEMQDELVALSSESIH